MTQGAQICNLYIPRNPIYIYIYIYIYVSVIMQHYPATYYKKGGQQDQLSSAQQI